MDKIPKMKISFGICGVFLVCLVAATTGVLPGWAQDLDVKIESVPKPPLLVQAEMCESIENFKPVNPAVVFSISLGRVYSFTSFDPVFEKTVMFHRWFRKDRLISNSRLVLNPPNWASFSSMQLRPVDKGPWRVEIVDSQDNLIKTLRFSISD